MIIGPKLHTAREWSSFLDVSSENKNVGRAPNNHIVPPETLHLIDRPTTTCSNCCSLWAALQVGYHCKLMGWWVDAEVGGSEWEVVFLFWGGKGEGDGIGGDGKRCVRSGDSAGGGGGGEKLNELNCNAKEAEGIWMNVWATFIHLRHPQSIMDVEFLGCQALLSLHGLSHLVRVVLIP